MNDLEQSIEIDAEDDREPKKAASGSIVQFIVLLNGTVLAVVAWMFLTMYIDNVLAGNRNNVTSNAYKLIKNDVIALENSIKATATIMGMSAEGDFETVRKKILYAVPELIRFDRVILMKETEDDWDIISIKHDDISHSSESFISGTYESLIPYLLENTHFQQGVVTIASNLPGALYKQESSSPLIKARLLAMTIRLPANEGANLIIVGFTRLTKVINYDYFINQGEVVGFNIKDKASNQNIFSLRRGGGTLDTSTKNTSLINENINFGTALWGVEIRTGKNPQTLFIEKMPWIMLIFGIVLTSIGTLYVRNNQKQAESLSAVNKALAQKNYELNSEVAERESLYQKMRKTDRENRAIIDAVSDIIFETNTEGEISFLNETWRSVTGFEVNQGINRNIFDMLHPHDQEEQRSNFEQLVNGQRHSYRNLTRLRTSNGSYRSVDLAFSMLRKDKNDNIKVVGTITDVEEHRRAEKALKEAERKYRNIVENTASGIYQVTPEGQFLSANPAVAVILGYSSSEELIEKVINAHEQLYVTPKERSRFIRELETDGSVSNFEIQMLKKDGTEIWVNENSRAVKDEEGNILYYEGSIEDVTKRKETEVELREAKIQSDLANRAKSEFLANMSHELRTPLNTIIGFSEIIKNEILGPIAQRQYWEYANDIYESGNNLLAIITEILDISRIEAGERQLNEGVVDVDKIVKSCLSIMAPRIESSEMVIKNNLEGAVPKIIGEEIAIKQIMMNLISNAVKFTPNGGRITLSHEIDSYGQLRISVTDTGIGLDEHEIEKALSPFGQIDTSMDKSSYGTGLGLTLVSSLMRLHGGEFELFSQKGVGTTATIIFTEKRVAKDPSKSSDTEKSSDTYEATGNDTDADASNEDIQRPSSN
jgi:PAS domain S-box-containing protein